MKTKDIILMAFLAAITCVCAVISIPLPFTPVPITLSVFAVLLTGALLSPWKAFLTQMVYILLGIVGIPVFSSFSSGLGVVAGPTGGYLIVYPIMAWIVAMFASYGKKHRKLWTGMGMLSAMLVCYAADTLWLCVQLGCGFIAGLGIGVIPYLIPDAAKLVLAFLLSAVLRVQMEKIFLSAKTAS